MRDVLTFGGNVFTAYVMGDCALKVNVNYQGHSVTNFRYKVYVVLTENIMTFRPLNLIKIFA